MADESTETQLALLKQWKESVEAHIASTDAAVKALQDERTKALKYGITTLGSAVLAMGYWMWDFVTRHVFK